MAEDADQRTAARRLAMDLLARREHSRQELKRKLLAREFPPSDIRVVLDALREEGLQNDRRFIEAFVRSRLSKGKGPLKVQAELAARGVPDALVHEVLSAAQADWVALATSVLSRRFGDEPVADFRDKARRMRFLAQRGFTSEQSQQALAQSGQVRSPAMDEEI